MIPVHETPALPGSDDAERLVASLQASSPLFAALFGRYGQASPALRHHGLIQWNGGEIDGAVASFRAALGLTPGDPDLWRDLAGAHDAVGQPAPARQALAMALRHRPDDATTWLLLANLESRMGAQDEAETGFRRALALDPTLGDAHFGLGILQFDRRRLDDAVASLNAAIGTGYANALGFGALGHVHYIAGNFADCAAAFDGAARFGPLEASAHRKQARARTFSLMIEGQPEQAMAGYDARAAPHAEDPADILRDAFAVLSGYGHLAAAKAVGLMRLAQNPEDATQRYLLDAISGEALTRAPLDYIEAHFDGFARTFDNKLVDVLLYRAPEEMARLVAETGRTFADTLDLGCGTGLAAAHLAPFGGRLTGVDISGRMLEEAARRGHYADLVKAEALAFLAGPPARFDLVFAADVLIYFGDLRAFFAGAARGARPGGLLVVSTETTEEGDYRLLPSGRFAHATHYVEACAAPHFTVLARRTTTLRLEANRPAVGLLLVLECRRCGALV